MGCGSVVLGDPFDGSQIQTAVDAAAVELAHDGLQALAREITAAQADTPFEDHAAFWNSLSADHTRSEIQTALGNPDIKLQNFEDKSEIYEYYYTMGVIGRVLIQEDGAATDKLVTGY